MEKVDVYDLKKLKMEYDTDEWINEAIRILSDSEELDRYMFEEVTEKKTGTKKKRLQLIVSNILNRIKDEGGGLTIEEITGLIEDKMDSLNIKNYNDIFFSTVHRWIKAENLISKQQHFDAISNISLNDVNSSNVSKEPIFVEEFVKFYVKEKSYAAWKENEEIFHNENYFFKKSDYVRIEKVIECIEKELPVDREQRIFFVDELKKFLENITK